ncbi:MAG: hypothetical protein SFX73_25805 [Kofleriaceae bacterium]|nr:hypothetical protein [Kofleriaceae bacterium]
MRTIPRTLSRLGLAVVCMFAPLVVSCASNTASIETTWVSPQAQPGELRSVVTMFVSTDGAMRRASEDRMAAALQAKGVRAIPSYAMFGEGTPDRDDAIAKMRAANIDGVVTMRIVSKGERIQPVSTGFVGYWGMVWTNTELVPETVVQVETNAYSLRTNKMLWAALSKSVDPSNLTKMITDVTQVVTRELGKEGFLSA